MIPDLAEYYGVLDYKGLPVKTLVALVFGLREGSRLQNEWSGNNISLNSYLLGYIADSLSFIAWTKTEGARRNRNRPKSILEAWKETKEKEQYMAFNSGAEFERVRAQIIGGTK